MVTPHPLREPVALASSGYSNTMNDRARLARSAWRTLSSRPIYAHPWIRVREDRAELPDGRTTIYGVVETKPAVGVLPFLDAETVVLVGQYRYVARGFYWEIPTGAVTPGETDEAAAQRELAEEAGYEAARLTKLCTFFTSKSVLDETAVLYSAEDLRPADVRPDPTEFIEVRSFAFTVVLRMVERGDIQDAMTIVAMLHAARQRGC
jgi:ADP-ribose pyrophosphatase